MNCQCYYCTYNQDLRIVLSKAYICRWTAFSPTYDWKIRESGLEYSVSPHTAYFALELCQKVIRFNCKTSFLSLSLTNNNNSHLLMRYQRYVLRIKCCRQFKDYFLQIAKTNTIKKPIQINISRWAETVEVFVMSLRVCLCFSK